MKTAYAVILTPGENGMYMADVPELPVHTSGNSLPEAIEMVRDALCVYLIQQDQIQEQATLAPAHEENQLVTIVDCDLDAYRRARDTRAIRKNVSIPSWLNDLAAKADISLSKVLQEALKKELGVENPYES